MVQNWPPPTTVRDVSSFLAFVSYYRHFTPGFTKKVMALYRLLQGVGAASRQKVVWTGDCQHTFEDLKCALVEALVLAYAHYTLLFWLYMDANLQALGVVLIQGGQEREMVYASQSLN